MKYLITIEESLAANFEIEANSEQEAIEIGRKMYKDGDLVLGPETCYYAGIGLAEDGNLEEIW